VVLAGGKNRSRVMRVKQRRIRITMNQTQILISILDHLRQPALVLDREGRVIVWNESIVQYTGVAAEDVIGKGSYAHSEALFGERRPTLADSILTHDSPGNDYYRILAHDSDELLAESRIPLVSGRRVTCMATPLYDPSGRQIGAVETFRDAPGERPPGVPEDEVQVLAKSLPDMIFTLNRDTIFLRFLWAGGKEMGLDTAGITGRTPHALFPEEEADFLARAARRVIDTGEVISEARSFLWHGEQRSFQVTMHPLHDATGEIVAAAGVARDRARELTCERTLHETRRFSSLYLDLLGTDIYNTSMVAATIIGMLKERLSGEEAELAQRVKNTIEQGITVIKNVELLNTLNKHQIRLEPADLDAVIRSQIKRHAGINIHYEGGSCMVWANPLLENVISNLISNSIKFGGMEVQIDIGVVETENTVTLSVTDNGIGIPDHLKLNIFDRFNQSSKSAPGSRGLGLHIVKTLVNNYGGRVWAADRVPGKPGEGAAIKVILQKC